MEIYIKNLLTERGIELFSAVSMSNCKITRGYKLKKCGFDENDALTVFIIAVPYLTPIRKSNLSAYAVCRDYHIFYKELFEDILPKLREKYPENRFFGFADDSPIDERLAAAVGGLGMIGDNGMLITEKYSSYVFLGEIITDMPISSAKALPVKHCEGCGKCREGCPMGETGQCLSATTQKKGELEESEKQAILRYGSVWGCDICQSACPHTEKAIKRGTIYTEINFFKEQLVPYLTTADIDSMTDEEFAQRAYSWRGRNTIRRNLELLESEGEL
jgi:epoxyqueuosine reductase